MSKPRHYTRPSFDEAQKAWKDLLARYRFPVDLLWVFEENLCFEKDPSNPRGFRLGFQTSLTPPPHDAERIAFHYFSDFDAPVVFYRLGSCRGKSVCALLCDQWFEGNSEPEGYARRDEWLIFFRPGGAEQELEEISDVSRWENRMLRDRPLHDLDFCMTLRAIHETLAHGRVLTTYERYALKLWHVWGRFLHHSPKTG